MLEAMPPRFSEFHLDFQVDLHFMKKIPTGAEASNVLVGEVDTLDRPIVAFVRLSPAVLLSGLTEVPIPTRYRQRQHDSVRSTQRTDLCELGGKKPANAQT